MPTEISRAYPVRRKVFLTEDVEHEIAGRERYRIKIDYIPVHIDVKKSFRKKY